MRTLIVGFCGFDLLLSASVSPAQDSMDKIRREMQQASMRSVHTPSVSSQLASLFVKAAVGTTHAYSPSDVDAIPDRLGDPLFFTRGAWLQEPDR
ncbi:MAG: hypothetical protein JWQ90_5436 [Hydrocarboniphaga sp.]|uniref:hypothetical protein n=1 Tax=Hydrocarboniphaga sp. TaxID=2033016 RepID=UPI00262AA4D1|nr:hypothetical protein [Hydrocarboniphaga sp.]MDB5972986.1 hypothetical protein [Hydrocarboniphaga sp.]